jgi:hypothetical protein
MQMKRVALTAWRTAPEIAGIAGAVVGMELVDVLIGIRLALVGMELAGFLFGLDKSFVSVVVAFVFAAAVVAAAYRNDFVGGLE